MTAERKGLILAIALPIAAVFLLHIESHAFGYDDGVVLDSIWLALLILAPGIAVVNLIRRLTSIQLSLREIIVIGAAIGFWIPILLSQLFRLISFDQTDIVRSTTTGF